MAKQKSTVELVYEALEAKGWMVDDVELDRGAITVTATAPDGEQLIDSFKQAAARKWLDGVRDVTPAQAEAELTVEEWEAQYGHLSDEDVAQALAPVVEEPEVPDVLFDNPPCGNDPATCRCACGDGCESYMLKNYALEELEQMAEELTAKKAAPETPEGGDEMGEEVKLCANDCGTIVEKEGDLCPDCAKALEALSVKEDALYEQYLSVREPYFDENPDLGMVFEAMLYRRWLYVRYQTDYTNGTSVIRDRKWLPSHVYQASSTGGVCVVAFDVCKKNGREERSIKTFRIDKIRGAHLGEIAPAAAGDAVTIYPAAYEVRRAVPQRVQNPGKYIATGMWSSRPLPQVLAQ